VNAARDNGRDVLGKGESCPIFYLKDTYDLMRSGRFWLSDTPNEPSYGLGAGCRRICTWAVLQNKETHMLYLHVNTHFDNASAEARAAAAEQILAWLERDYATMPTVFTADLNATERGAAYGILSGTLTDTRYAATDSVSCPTFHDCAEDESGYITLDHIFCSADIAPQAFRVVTTGIDGRFVSDHFPLYADLIIPDVKDSFAGHEFPLIEPEEKAKGDTRVMSFNIRCVDLNGVEADFRRTVVTEEILRVQPDSVGIQEATPEWVAALEDRLCGYAWVGLERDGGKPADQGGESCPIFYLKAKYRLVDHGDFWISDTPDVPSFGPGAACRRICTWAILKNRLTGETYVHVNTHFDHISEEARVQGGENLNRYIEEHFSGMNVVFTADMNTTPDTETYVTMTANLKDARLAAADSVGYGTFHGCRPEDRADYYIDFVLCSPDIEVTAYRTVTAGINGRFVSDHFPIYADLTLGGRQSLC
jgi:endonuclease/exonuclease/phosphatase family metal-dependent hydrolase